MKVKLQDGAGSPFTRRRVVPFAVVLLATSVMIAGPDPSADAGSCVNGWQHDALPDPLLPTGDGYFGITTPSADTGWMVGSGEDADGTKPMMLQRIAGAWTAVTAPMEGDTASLKGIDSIGADDVWAVGSGYSYPPSMNFALAAHWDGDSWTTSTPFIGDYQPMDVEMIATDDVWMTGARFMGAAQTVFTAHWDGISWTPFPVPAPRGDAEPWVWGISDADTDDVWIVGDTWTGSRYKTYILHWDGVEWTKTPSPNTKSKFNYLLDVEAVSANDAWAVGSGSGRDKKTLILHWDGKDWSKVKSPNPGDRHNSLLGIASSASKIYAVGYTRSSTSKAGGALILRLKGSTWRRIIPPGTGQSEYLGVISADPAGTFTAAGWSSEGDIVKSTC